MRYISTRGGSAVTASEAILRGIAPDGGLYVPESFPSITAETLSSLCKTSDYRLLAYEILLLFLTDFTETELRECVDRAYDGKFDCDIIAPVSACGGFYFLELYHGPTLAFKDMALTILPHFMNVAAKHTGKDTKTLILTATSGDTGKAALAGFADVADTAVMVFYPQDGVSEIQKLQMITQEGSNTCVVGIDGNFDHAQTGVKTLFADENLRKELADLGYTLSSANSINIGRLLPQIIYYFHAYAQMVSRFGLSCGEAVDFCVPTGNFGNILAGYYAKRMGLPIGSLICASNDNKVLYDFFTTGTYDKNRPFYTTISPSMDILISSNLERLLYHLSDASQVSALMKNLEQSGSYDFLQKTEGFLAGYASEVEALNAIETLHSKGMTIDPHTAVALAVARSLSDTQPAIGSAASKTIILSTASPYKFAADVLKGIGYTDIGSASPVTALSEATHTDIPERIKDLHKKPVLHKQSCAPEGMKQAVLDFVRL